MQVCVCILLTHAPGGYIREKLMAYKGLEAYNYYERLSNVHIGLGCSW